MWTSAIEQENIYVEGREDVLNDRPFLYEPWGEAGEAKFGAVWNCWLWEAW